MCMSYNELWQCREIQRLVSLNSTTVDRVARIISQHRPPRPSAPARRRNATLQLPGPDPARRSASTAARQDAASPGEDPSGLTSPTSDLFSVVSGADSEEKSIDAGCEAVSPHVHAHGRAHGR